jgi:disulfide bond formation protein DsbB
MFADRLSLARFVAVMTPALLIGGALWFQFVRGLHPCEMCYWQRWPHLAAIALALVAIGLHGNRAASGTFTALAALAILTSGAIGVFHAGVEYHWWQGLTACSTTGPSDGDMLKAILASPLVRCDAPAWTLFGVSMAGYNALISIGAGLLTLALVATMRRTA